MRDVRVAEVARLARRWLGADALARRQESDAWWAALALRCARAALATDSGPGGAEQARADAITALTAALDLGLDAGTASLPALLEQHAPVAFSLPPAGSAVLRDPVDRVAPPDDGAWWTWSPLPADRDPVLTWPMPPVLLSRYRPLPGGTSAGDERDEALPAGRGLRLLVEYTRTGAPERLDEAVTLLERAVRTVASDSEAANGDLAWALLQRFTRSELRADLDGSVEHAMVAGVFDRDDEGGDARAPVWLAVLGLALLTRYELTGGPADLDNAVGALHRSVTALGEGHPDFDAVTSALADALLYRHGLTGASADLRLAGELVFTPEQPVAYAPSVYAAFLEDGDPTALNDAVGQARSALTRIRDDTRRPWALNGLAGFLLARYAALHDPSDAWAAVDRLQEARALLPPGTTPYATVLVNLAHALTAGPQRDTPAAARLATEALDTPHISVRLEAQALELLCALAELSGHPDELALAPDLLDRRLTTLLEQRADAPADPRRTALRWAQARLRRSSGRPAEGLELARAVQEDRVWDVLAQPDAGESFRRARRALAEAAEMAVWMEEDGEPREAFAAIESARALTVLAATEADPVSARLTALGSGELQERWLLARTSAPTDRDPSRLPSARRGLGDAGPGADVPPELRAEVRGALLPSAGAGPQDFLGRPTPDALAEPLHAIGADAVVHVVAGRGHTPGLALVLHATGEVASLVLPHLSEQARELRGFARAHDECLRSPGDRAAGSAWRTALRQVCDWSWRAAVHAVHDHLSARAGAEAGRIPHVVFVPTGVLGLVPWHAARRKHEGARRYAIEDMCFSYAPSASALDGFARRQRSVPDGTGLVVADPLGDLPHARQEGADLHRWYYSKGSRLGRSGAADAMPATPRAVLEALLADGDGPGPAVVHFACHARSCAPATESHLVLAGGQRLSVGSLLAHARPPAAHGRNPLVVLAACATAVPGDQYDEALSLATAFAAAGASCVIGTLWTVGDEHATRLMTDFHHFLNLDGLPAAQSLRQSQLRALDRARSRTAGSGPAARTRAEDPAHWAAFLHYGTGFPGPGGVRGGPDAEALSGSATDGLGPAAGTRSPLFSRMPGRERSEVIWICPQRDCLRRAAGDAKAPFDEDTCPDHPRQALRRE